MSSSQNPSATVFVLDHEPVSQEEPVYHVSEECSMVSYSPDAFVEVPKWVVERAGIRRCRTSGVCAKDSA